MKNEVLSNNDVALIRDGRCPRCYQGFGFVIGPGGGNSQNIECANAACRARFNVGVVVVVAGLHFPSIMMGWEIDRESEGGSDWSGMYETIAKGRV